MSFTTAETSVELARLKAHFLLLPETPDFVAEWEKLVVAHDVKGRPAHDARLVAAMLVHGIGRILTFNVRDFARYPGVAVLDPDQVVAGSKASP